MASLKSQGLKAFAWNFFGTFSTQAAGFIVTLILARILEPEDFGNIAIITVLIAISSLFSNFGLASALIQRKRVHKYHLNSVFYFNLFSALLLTLLFIAAAPWVAAYYESAILTSLIQVLSITFLLNALISVQSTILRRDLNYKAITNVNIVSSLGSGGLGLIMAYYGYGVWSLVAQNLSYAVINAVGLWLYSTFRPSLLFSMKALKQLWAYGIHIFLAGILENIFSRIDYLIIGKLFNLEILGYFQRAKSLNQLAITYSAGTMMSIWLRMLSSVQDDMERFRYMVRQMYLIITYVSFFLAGGMFVTAHELIIILFSEKWVASIPFFQLLNVIVFAYPLSAIIVNILTSRGKSKTFLHLEIYKKVFLALALIVGFYFGIYGYLYALIIVGFIGLYLNIYFAAKEIDIAQKEFIFPVIIQFIVTAIAILPVVYFLDNRFESIYLLFALKGSFFVVNYIAFNYLFQVQSSKVFLQQATKIIKRRLNKTE